jgi:hypothetical protein
MMVTMNFVDLPFALIWTHRAAPRAKVSRGGAVAIAFVFLASFPAVPAFADYGPETCKAGFVWREACSANDHVCVLASVRSQASKDNAAANARRQGAGPYGPDTCKQGYVWREACGPQDHVCVLPATRTQAAQDNSQKLRRFQGDGQLWDVLTQHNDNARTGSQLHEKILTPQNVTSATFGKLYERTVDGQIIAQPLYVSNQWDDQHGLRNVVYVATRANTLYAFDADDLDPNPAHGLIWKAPITVEPAAHPNMCGESQGPLGITATPVIDRDNSALYVVARKSDGTIWLNAINIVTGQLTRAVQITAAQNGVTFNQALELSRAGLLLANGAVYIGFSALNCDNAGWHGWLLSYRVPDLTQTGAFVTTSAQGWGGGIWASGKGLVSDGQAGIFFETGNGSVAGASDLGESFVKLAAGAAPFYPLTLNAHYAVSNWQALNNGDTDLGSSGPLLLPGSRLVGGGKQGKLYVFDSSTLQPSQNGPSAGAVPAGGSDGIQAFVNSWHDDSSQPACMIVGTLLYTNCFLAHARYEESELTGPNLHSGIIYWNGRIYGMPEKDFLRAFNYNAASQTLSPVAAAVSMVRSPDGMPGAALEISANGNSNGIVWASIPKYDGQWQNVPGRLVAFDAQNLQELWRDDDDIAYAKFDPPTVAGGKVFRPTFANKLIVYGNKNGNTPASCYSVSEVYINLAAENGLLGSAIGSEQSVPGGTGRFQNFANGSIYWSPSTCGFEVTNAVGAEPTSIGIGNEWAKMGLATGLLGYPLTSETIAPDGIGRYNHFQFGSIYSTLLTGSHEVHGAIRDRWASLGWERSELGYPISDEIDEIDGTGRVSLFEHGAIHWKRSNGAISVEADANVLLEEAQVDTDRPGFDIAHFPLPENNPWMCAASCAGNTACHAWSYVAPNTTQGPLPQCWLKSSTSLPQAASCCVSGIKIAVQPSNMSPIQGAFDRLGSDFATFNLPAPDPRLCQGECAINGTCRAWAYAAPAGSPGQNPAQCWLKNAAPASTPNVGVSSGAKN